MSGRWVRRVICWVGLCALGCAAPAEDVGASTNELDFELRAERVRDAGVVDAGAARRIVPERPTWTFDGRRWLRDGRAPDEQNRGEESSEERSETVLLFDEETEEGAESAEQPGEVPDPEPRNPVILLQDGEVGRPPPTRERRRCTFDGFFGLSPTLADGTVIRRRRRPIKIRFAAVQPHATMTDNGAWGIRVRMVPRHPNAGNATIRVSHQLESGRGPAPGSAVRRSGNLTPAGLQTWLRGQDYVVVRPPPLNGQPNVDTRITATAEWTVGGQTCTQTETLDLRWLQSRRGRTTPVFDRGTRTARGAARRTEVRAAPTFRHPAPGVVNGRHTVEVNTVHPVEDWNTCCRSAGCGHSVVQFVRHEYELGADPSRTAAPGEPAISYRDAWSLDILDSEVTIARAQRRAPAVASVVTPPDPNNWGASVRVRTGFDRSPAATALCPAGADPGGAFCGGAIPPRAGDTYDPTYTHHPRPPAGGDTNPIVYPGPDHNGRAAIIQRDAPGMSDALYQELVRRGGSFTWRFFTLLVCDQQPRNADQFLANARVRSWIEHEVTATFTLVGRDTRIQITQETLRRKRYSRGRCKRLISLLCSRDTSTRRTTHGSLLEGYLHPRHHTVALPRRRPRRPRTR